MIIDWFDQYPVFYRNKSTNPQNWLYGRDRMCFRHIGIIQKNPDLFVGKRVLDLASHDGRWTWAALQAGAREVVGVEARPLLVDTARKTFEDLGAENWQFHQGDAHKVHEMDLGHFDTVMCLGFFYHTIRHYELLYAISQVGRDLLLDTTVSKLCNEQPVIELRDEGYSSVNLPEGVERKRKPFLGMAVPDEMGDGPTLSGTPNRPALRKLLARFGWGFDVKRYRDVWPLYKWRERLIRDYRIGTRITIRCDRGQPRSLSSPA